MLWSFFGEVVAWGLPLLGLAVLILGQKKAIARWIGGSILLVWALGFFVPVEESKETSRKHSCLSNTKRLAQALAIYASDDDDHFPAKGGLSVVSRKFSDGFIYRCFERKDGPGYALNAHVLGPKTSTLNPLIVLVFESDAPSLDFVGDAKDLPREPRHDGGENFSLVDGHAKYFLRNQEASLRWYP